MKRKLVRQGASTLMVSLPCDWAKQNNLDKGDEINLDVENNKIVIGTNSLPEKKSELDIDLSAETETAIRTIITNGYRLGYDTLRVRFKSPTQFKIMSNVVTHHLLGFEIIHKEDNFCVIESVAEPSQESVDSIFRKYLYSISELLSIAKNILNGSQEQDALEEMERNIQNYDNFCRRVIFKDGVGNRMASIMWAFQSQILHGQRDIYSMAKHLPRNKVSGEAKAYFEEIISLFEEIRDAYQKKDVSKAEKIHEKHYSLIYEHGKKLVGRRPGESFTIHKMMSSIRSFYLSTSPLIGLLIIKI